MNQEFQCDYDSGWANDQLGTCEDNGITTICQSGCAITSMAMLAGKTPRDVNNLLIDNGGYGCDKYGCCNIFWQRASDLLGLEFNGEGDWDGVYPCILRLNLPHYIVALDDQTAYDPYYGTINWVEKYKNNGNVVDYLNIRSKTNQNMANVKIQKYYRDKYKQKWFAFGEAVEPLEDKPKMDINYESVLPDWLYKDLAKSQADLKTANALVKTRDLKVAELTGQVNTLTPQVTSLQSEIDAKNKQLEADDTEISQLKEQIDELKNVLCESWWSQLINWFKNFGIKK